MKDELDAIIDSSYDGIFVSDGQGLTLRVNEAYSRIIGNSGHKLVGRLIGDLVAEGFFKQSATQAVLESRERVTICQKLKNGNTILVTGNPIFDEDGNIIRVVTNARDITELNRLKNQLQQAENLTQHFQMELNKYKFNDKYLIQSQNL